MRTLILGGCLALVLAVSMAAQYHEPVYLTGGFAWSSPSTVATGLWVIDGRRQTATTILPPTLRHSWIDWACMDSDNLRIVFSAYADTFWTVQNGLFRLDPTTGIVQTLCQGHLGAPGKRTDYHGVLVDQDGGYVFAVADWSMPPSGNLVKLDTVNNRLTTLLSSSVHLGGHIEPELSLGRDIDTGNLLWCFYPESLATIYNWSAPVLRVDPYVPGKWSTFSNGGGSGRYAAGWGQYGGSLSQDFATGGLRTVIAGSVSELLPGTTPSRGLYRAGAPGNFFYTRTPGGFDLQSAARRRYVVAAEYRRAPPGPGKAVFLPAILMIDETTYYTTGMICDPNHTTGFAVPATHSASVFMPYRGRHVASVKLGPRRWQLRFSVPHLPGKRYVAAAGISGVRPPVQLPDGRRIWLRVDDVTLLSLRGALRGWFDPGPGVLDTGGEAQGTLDLRALGSTGGLPLWIALVVLDRAAPCGVAFIPDPYVMRIP